MTKSIFLLFNLVIAFYNVGTIWAHEIDIFRHWKFLDRKTFDIVRNEHWKKIPYWVFIPVGFSFIGSVTLIWYHPERSPSWAIWGSFFSQIFSHLLTILFWGRWQAQLTNEILGAQSPILDKIIKTHWIRTALINIYALILFIWTIKIIS
jgi:hypothetical protein